MRREKSEIFGGKSRFRGGESLYQASNGPKEGRAVEEKNHEEA
ncbi:MAG TPA: hypothetical protein VM694_40980 [Polyangium sp.]|nr:hypothetical protein [Polyangium sp.]